MAFLLLFTGHLAGDFLFQTDKIAQFKAVKRNWNLLHSMVVTFCIFVFSIPLGPAVLLLVLLNGLLHYYIDLLKPHLTEKYSINAPAAFLADQLLHTGLLFLVSRFAVINDKLLFINRKIAAFIMTALLVSVFSAVFGQILLSSAFGLRKKFFEEGEKYAGNIARLTITFGVYFSLTLSGFFLLPVVPVMTYLFIQYKKKWHGWMPVNYFYSKLLLDLLFSAGGVMILLKMTI